MPRIVPFIHTNLPVDWRQSGSTAATSDRARGGRDLQPPSGAVFRRFADKNELALALIERHIEIEDAIFDDLFGRATELSDDPLQRMLIGLKFLAELLADMPGGHPGCIVATAAYQDRQFRAGVRDANRRAVLGWRARFRAHIDAIVAAHPPRDTVDLDALADMVNGVIEGGIVLAKALNEPRATEKQVLLLRSYLKLLFAPWPNATASPATANAR